MALEAYTIWLRHGTNALRFSIEERASTQVSTQRGSGGKLGASPYGGESGGEVILRRLEFCSYPLRLRVC